MTATNHECIVAKIDARLVRDIGLRKCSCMLRADEN